MDAPTCVKCNLVMEEGFTPDVGYGGAIESMWIAGKPEKTWLGRVRIPNSERYAVSAYRCPECGRIELFALKRAY